MRPARRRKISVKRRKFPILKILLALLVVFLVFVFFKRETRFWNGKDKLSIVINKNPDEIVVATFDPGGSDITAISIPADTQVNVARNLGIWRLQSIWKLGQAEKIGGLLLSRTIAKNFYFPTFVWADAKAIGFTEGDAGSLIAAVFAPYSSNLGVGDKIQIALFSIGVKNINKTAIDLSDTSLIKKSTLKDGKTGYVISGAGSPEISAIFSDRVANLSLRTQIKDGSGVSGVSQRVGTIVEVLGPKVAQIDKGKIDIKGCRTSGKYKDLTEKVARIFGCSILSSVEASNFDLTIELGEDFPNQF